jgi:N-ethylmaleimide reductase
MTDALFSELKLGQLQLDHRIVMAPLTRMRADVPGNIPNDMMAEYYSQRASKGGLIIAEASQISQSGRGAPSTPGIHSSEQIAGWQKITTAIHDKGGYAYLQLWHMGRLSHPEYQPDGGAPFAPSAVAANTEVLLPDRSRVACPTPRAMTAHDIQTLISDYVHAATCAIEAGFDGIEIHSANGYLLEQFLQSKTNIRTDEWGGSIENRCRLIITIAAKICEAIGADRVGIRLSPFGIANDSGEDDPMPLYTYLIDQLNHFKLSYLHLIEPRASGTGQREVNHTNVPSAAELFRPIWEGRLIIAGNFERASAFEVVEKGYADAVAFGRYFISNPDLPRRLHLDKPLNAYDRATFYAPGAKGYIDYPFLE